MNHRFTLCLLLLLSGVPFLNAQNVGIGVAAPTSKLHVVQPTTNVKGIYVDKTGQDDGLFVSVTNATGGLGNAMQIDFNSNTAASSAFWYRSWGDFGALNIDNWGLGFGAQVWNRNTTTTNTALQVTQEGLGRGMSIGMNASNADTALYLVQNGTGVGSYFWANGRSISAYSANNYSVYGFSNTTYGIYGYANGGAQGAGIYGRAATFSGVTGSSGGGSTYGVFSFGDYGGTGAKYFVIDHPLDPANQMLKHFCIESDEPMLVYRGKVQLDANGEAVIQLEDYVAAINKDYTYNLTSIGQFMPVYIADEVNANGQFRISGGTAGATVAWTVYGMRNDAYMQAHPDKLDVEMQKTGDLAGKYLDPASHGQPAEMGIDFDAENDRQARKMPTQPKLKPAVEREK